MTVSLCLPLRNGEPCISVRIPIDGLSTIIEIPSRHRVTGVEAGDDIPRLCLDIADPEYARPVYARIDLVPADVNPDLPSRSQLCGNMSRDGRQFMVYGTYLGVVSDEN